MDAMTDPLFHQKRFPELAVPMQTMSPSLCGPGAAGYMLDCKGFLDDLAAQEVEIQEQFMVDLDQIRRLIFLNTQDFSPIDLGWINKRCRSCSHQQLDQLNRILLYEGGKQSRDVPDGPSPVSQSSWERNMAEMYALFQLSVPEKIKPIEMAKLDIGLAGLCAALHLTDQWLVEYKAPQSGGSSIVGYVVLGGGFRCTKRAWIDKDITGSIKSLHASGIDAYAELRPVCSQDKQPPLRDLALKQVKDSMRYIRGRNPSATLLVWAWSAGGYLVACSEIPVDICVLVYPVLSMKDSLTDQGTQWRALGRAATDDEKDVASAQTYVGNMQKTKFLVIHSIEDRQVPIQATINFLEAAHKQGCSINIDFGMSGPHGGFVDLKYVERFIEMTISGKQVRQDIDFSEIKHKVAAGIPVRI